MMRRRSSWVTTGWRATRGPGAERRLPGLQRGEAGRQAGGVQVVGGEGAGEGELRVGRAG